MTTRAYHTNWTHVALLLGAASGCVDSAGPTPEAGDPPSIAEAQGQSQDDPGLRMRLALRSRPDDELERLVRDNGNIVGIAFRPVGTSRGVDSRGQSLVAANIAASREEEVAAQASRVLYRFNALPAMIVELPSPSVATQLRRLPWVDYVVPNTALLSADQGSGCTPFNMSQQTVPWNVTRVRADLAWSQALGTNGELLILDDGTDITESYPNGWQDWPWNSGRHYSVGGTGNATGAHGTLVMSTAVARKQHGGDRWHRARCNPERRKYHWRRSNDGLAERGSFDHQSCSSRNEGHFHQLFVQANLRAS